VCVCVCVTLMPYNSEIPLDGSDQTLSETRVGYPHLRQVRGLCLVGFGPVGPV